MRRLLRLAWLLLAVAVPARAAEPAEFRHIRAGEPLQLRPDRAYILLRIDTTVSHFAADILRVPGPDEIAAYEEAKRAAHAKAGGKPGAGDAFIYHGRPNLFEISSSRALVTAGKTATMLVEVTPGDYVFYGEGANGHLYECFCLGTVGFDVPAGEVTDLGTMFIDYAARPQRFPELAGEVNLGPSAFMDFALWAVALRPRRAGDIVPAGLDAAKVRPARLHAVGTFVEPNTTHINRLAPIPGILAYDSGRVIDVPTGREVEGH